MTRKISFLICAAMLLVGLTTRAWDFYAANNDGVNIYYTITSSSSPYTVSVTYDNNFNTHYSGNVVIPSTVTYNSNTYSVTSIGYAAFYNCTALTSVTIPNSVTSIGSNAFYYCSSLNSVTIPNSVTSIGEEAFYYCSSLNSVTIPNSVTSIGSSAFDYCSGLTSVTIGNSVTSIGSYAFYDDNIAMVLIKAATPPTLENNSFSSDVTDNAILYVPDSSLTAYSNASYWESFHHIIGIDSNTDVAFTENGIRYMITSIPQSQVAVTSKDTLYFGDLSLPNSVTHNSITYSVKSIGNNAFKNCNNLTSITIPDSVASIGQYAFKHTGLTSITIPQGIDTIGRYAFANCTGLATVNYNATDAYYNNSYYNNGSMFDKDTNLVTVTIGDNVQTIPDDFVQDCKALTSITIPNSVTNIGYNAFEGCIGLTSITIPKSVNEIGNYAFSNCSGLTMVNYNAANVYNAYAIFSGDTNLTTVTIGDSVQTIPNYFVQGCKGLTSITIPEGVNTIGLVAFSLCPRLLTVNYNAKNAYVPDNYSIFRGDSNLTTLNIGSTVQSLPNYFLSGDIENGIDYRFKHLSSIAIPSSVTKIGQNALNACVALTSLTIPHGVDTIGQNAFANCMGLTTVNYNAKNAYYNATNSSMFNGDTNLVTVTIGDSVQSIPNYFLEGYINYNANEHYVSGVGYVHDTVDYRFKNITSINLPDNLKKIGLYSFSNCKGLSMPLTIPNNVDTIGFGAFEYCPSLTTVNYNAKNAYVIGDGSIFNGDSNITTVNIGHNVQTIPSKFLQGTIDISYRTNANGGYVYDANNHPILDTVDNRLRNITSITIPESVDTIGSEAFVNCIGLTTVNYNAKNAYYNTNISSMFDRDTNIMAVTIGDSVQTIPNCFLSGNLNIGQYYVNGNYVYDTVDYRFKNITSITIPNSVTTIGKMAFANCINLGTMTLPSSLEYIGQNAFNNIAISTLTIPQSVYTIGGGAFSNCNNLISVNYNAKNAYNDYQNGSYSIFNSDTNIAVMNIGDSVQSIPNYFLDGEINYYANGHYDYNTGEYIVDTIDYRFANITSIVFPSSLTQIGEQAFNGCSGLTEITIPQNVTSIGWKAFYGTNIHKVNYNAINCASNNYHGDVPMFGYLTTLDTLNIGSSVQTLPSSFMSETEVNDANYNTTLVRPNVRSITIPNSVTTIGKEAFYHNSSLENIKLSDNLLIVDTSTFDSCFRIKSVVIPNSVTNIKYRAFNHCDSLNVLTVGSSVTNIAREAFNECIEMDSIYSLAAVPPVAYNTTFNDVLPDIPCVVACGSVHAYNNKAYWRDFTVISDGGITIVNVDATICQGETYTQNGFNVSLPGTYSNSLTSASGCDSTINLTLTVRPSYHNNINATINQGESYTFAGMNLVTAGTYADTLQTAYGCDSITTLHLVVNDMSATNIAASICQGETYTLNGFNVSTAGTYTQHLTRINGSDSTITLTLSVNPTYNDTITAAITEGHSYSFNGRTLTQAGMYADTLQTINGCDSIINLHLIVYNTVTTSITASICQGETYNLNGFTQTETGTYTHTLQAVTGADSIVTLHLTVYPQVAVNLTANICGNETYSFAGQTLTTAGTYTDTLQTIKGCDSIVTLTLNVNPIYNTPLTQTICQGESYMFGGVARTSAGTYTDTLQTIKGCDSVITLTLNVNPTYNTPLTQTICQGESYLFAGSARTTAGTYTDTLQTIKGCDSVITLTLNVNPTYNTPLTQTICQGESYMFGGIARTTAGTYVDSLQTINGCDSVITLTLNVNPTYNTPLTQTICQGESYTFGGQTLTSAGTYTDTLQTINGCDSVITLTLNVNPTYNTPLTQTICQGESYIFGGQTLTSAGTYTDTLQTINGCDSVVTLTLAVNPTYNDTILATIHQGETYNLNGFNADSTGIYVHTLQSINGCDSTVVLNLTVQSSLNSIDNENLTVTLYPNPTRERATLSIEGLKEKADVRVYDLQGREVQSQSIFAGQKKITLDVSTLAKGAYSIRITTSNGKNITRKLIVQ